MKIIDILKENINNIPRLKWVEMLSNVNSSTFDKIYDLYEPERRKTGKDWDEFLFSLPSEKKYEIYKQLKNLPVNEALETPCQTPGVEYNINISENKINIEIDLQTSLNIDENEAEILEANIHNSIEVILSKYFKDEN